MDEKASLEEQYKNALAYGQRMGGQFLEEFRLEGYSRTDYFDLSLAFQEIPRFGELGEYISKLKTDVILVESYDRLGDLAFAFYLFLKPYRVQFRSVQQALPIEDPATYNPRRDDSTVSMIANSMTINNYRINKIVRAFQVGIPQRARQGKFGNTFPYGYIRKDRDELILDPPVAGLLAKFPAWFLSGVTISDIARRANESGIPPRIAKQWSHDTVKYILQNPFYTGQTFYGIGERDPLTKHYKRRQDYQLYAGQHEALWTWDTHLQIMAEFDRRKRHKSKPTDYAFTKLLQCSTCGGYLSVVYSSKRPQNKFWRCLNGGHVQVSQRDAIQKVGDELVRLFQDVTYTPTPEVESKSYTQKELVRVETQIRRERAAYDAGAYDPAEYAEILKGLKARKQDLEDGARQEEEARRRIADRRRSVATMQELLPHIHELLAEGPARMLNYHLQRVVKLEVFPNKTIKGERLI
jgi:DNA invertase Pin-like site-specific DNA recombinase